MDSEEINHFRKLLLQEEEELLALKEKGRESTLAVELDQSSVGRLSRMDAMQSQAMALENQRRRELQLTRIKAALERIEQDKYGYCASCDEEIDRRRLEFDPAAPFCVECANAM
jgi:DnaK suppressor protein